MGALNRLRSIAETGLIGLFFIQALRAAVGLLYGRYASASIYAAIDLSLIDSSIPGIVPPAVVRGEFVLLAWMVALPVITLLVGRWRGTLFLAGLAAAGARLVMALDSQQISMAAGAVLTIGAALIYFAVLVRHRLVHLPYAFVIGFTADQLLRAVGNTLDPALSPSYSTVQVVLSATLALLVIVNSAKPVKFEPQDSRGLFTVWGGLGFGALLFLELSLLASPNAIAGRAGSDYTMIVPLLIVATALPLAPVVQRSARGFVTLFDPSAQGWVWMLFLILLVVVGTRVQGAVGSIALVVAQLVATLTWWWLARPQAEKERNASALWLVIGMLIFALLVVCDVFTYEYAYVRDFAGNVEFLNRVIAPMLRGFRGLGLAVVIFAIVIASLPVVASRRRAVWGGGPGIYSLFALLIVAVAGVAGAVASRPRVIPPFGSPTELRVGTFNIHAGYNEFFHYDLEATADAIFRSGADLIMLQEVDAGRLTSFGVDQTLWLARRVGMDRRFYATNEGLQGLAVLSKAEITLADGYSLTSVGMQTGVQRVRIRPDEGEITFYNTWLGVLLEVAGGSISQQEQDQSRQLDGLLGIMSDHGGGRLGSIGRLVVGGTFNNIPSSDLIQRMRQTGLSDPFEEQPQENSKTFVQTGRSARYDYLFTNMLALGAIVVDSTASDHRLAVIGLSIE
ncbi:MAG: endonuclease/exonuclease/phosphatase family protein [Anaerolineae bacterium]|nr:endonuclease/exonuclease/phosphatase family protein [Chloroflexota bacterium]MBP6298327.1 endonuclease/exonuclease/phosphatase family protein [Anaerolineae bacterium]